MFMNFRPLSRVVLQTLWNKRQMNVPGLLCSRALPVSAYHQTMDEPKWDQVHNDETLQHNLLISPCQTSDRSRFPADKRMIFCRFCNLINFLWRFRPEKRGRSHLSRDYPSLQRSDCIRHSELDIFIMQSHHSVKPELACDDANRRWCEPCEDVFCREWRTALQHISFTQSSKFCAQQTGTRPVEACKKAMKNAKLVCVF